MAAQPLIELEGIGKSYKLGDGRLLRVLDDIRLRVEPGESLAMMGPSGSGKSTLMNLIGLLDTPDEGVFRLEGRSIAGQSQSALARLRRETIGFVFQSFHLIPRLSALANVELPMRFTGRGVDSDQARSLLERLGMGHRLSHPPEKLSGGERQRVAVARALVNRPRLILADEPTGNLDSKTGAELLDILMDLNRQGLTLILVTHDPEVARRAGRRVHLVDGRLADQPSIATEPPA